MSELKAKHFRAWAEAVNQTPTGYIDQSPGQWIKAVAEHIAALAEIVEEAVAASDGKVEV